MRPLYIHFGTDDPVAASPEQRQILIESVIADNPRLTEATALEALYALSPGERRRILMGVHERAQQHRLETDRVFRIAAEVERNQARRDAETDDLNYDPVWGSPPARVAHDNWGQSMPAPLSGPRNR